MNLTRPLPVRAATRPPSLRPALPASCVSVVNVVIISIFFASPLCARQERPATTALAAPPRREVRLTVTVTDGEGNYVTGLGREHFEVFDGKAPGEITSFGASEEPASVVALFDMSDSTSGEDREWVWDALRRSFVAFGRKSLRENEYALFAFNKKLVELTDWTRDPLVIARALAALDPKAVPRKDGAWTALYDSCAAALERFARASRRKRVLLVFTDGERDNASRRTRLGGLKKLVRESGALVYAVAVGPHLDRPRSYGEDDGLRDLEELAAVSGGRAFFPRSSAEANAVAERIALELRHQYVVGIAAAGAARPGELNRIEVRVSPPRLKQKIFSRGPDGYHSAPN